MAASACTLGGDGSIGCAHEPEHKPTEEEARQAVEVLLRALGTDEDISDTLDEVRPPGTRPRSCPSWPPWGPWPPCSSASCRRSGGSCQLRAPARPPWGPKPTGATLSGPLFVYRQGSVKRHDSPPDSEFRASLCAAKPVIPAS
jgi:hypothetical protein